MRRGSAGALVLIGFAIALCGGGAATDTRADDLAPRATAGVTSYSESMNTSIVTTSATVGMRVPGEVELDAAWNADIISSASVDVISAATDRIDELRNQVGLAASRESIAPDLDLDAGYAFSTERDSYSHIMHAGVRQGLWDDNLTLSLSYGLSYNRMGVRNEPTSLWRSLWVHTLDLGVTYTLNPDTTLELLYTGGYSHGYHANRYRRVPVTFRQDLRATEWIDEAAPDTRVRNSVTGRAQHAFGKHWIATLDYRFYWDTWGVVGHTLTVGGSVALPGHVTLALRARGSEQSAASFYETIYTSTTEFRTRDRRLSSHLSGLAGGSVAWNFGSYLDLEVLELRASVDGVIYTFDDFVMPALDSFGGAPWTTLGDVTGLIWHVEIGGRL